MMSTAHKTRGFSVLLFEQTPDVSRFPRMWYCLLIRGKGQENSLESMKYVMLSQLSQMLSKIHRLMLQAMLWLLWRDLSSTSMTRPVTSVTLMRHGNIYFARKPGTLKTSLLPKQRSFSRQTSRVPGLWHLGPGNCAIPSTTRSIRQGMEAGERGMGAKLDATSAGSYCMCRTCKKSCRILCRCAQAGLTCNALCLCGGFAFNICYYRQG